MAWPNWLVDLWTTVKPYADRAAVWRGYEQDLTTLTILTVGVTLYTLLVFSFYQNLSRRSAYHTDVGKGTWWGTIIRGIESTLVFPVMSFLYFSVLALALFFLAKALTTYQIFLVSMAVVAAVRLTSFVTEGAAGDLAKLLPLALLGVLIVDPSHMKWSAVWARYLEIPGLLPVLGRFFLLFLVFETGLRFGKLAVDRTRAALAARRKPSQGDAVSLEIVEGTVGDAPKAKPR